MNKSEKREVKEKNNKTGEKKERRLNEAVEEIRYWFPRAKHSFVLTAEIFG